MGNSPKISVLMPVYNGGRYLREAIQSILNQAYADFEFIIINDGSSDDSDAIIRSYDDRRIIYVENGFNIGLIGTLNKGMSLAKGEYIARMDQDDISLPKRFAKQVEFLEKYRNCGACGSWFKIFGDAVEERVVKNSIDSDRIKAELLFFNPLAHPTVMMRRDFFNKYNLRYDEKYKDAEDYDLWSRASKFFELRNVPQVLLKYRISPGQITQKYQEGQNTTVMSIRRWAVMDFSAGINEDDIFMHEILGTHNSPETEEFVNRAEEWLLKIIDINNKNEIYRVDFLGEVAGIVYYNLLLKNISSGIPVLNRVFFSRLSRQIKFLDKLKFVIKYLNKILR